jgi:hypothetical protein
LPALRAARSAADFLRQDSELTTDGIIGRRPRRSCSLRLELSDMSDNRNREKQQLELDVTGGARFVRQGGATPRARGRL